MNAVRCVLCNRSANPTIDLCFNQDGKAVHEKCYFNHTIGHSTVNLQPLYENNDNVETLSTALHCLPTILDTRVCTPSMARTAC
jgi:hypothetical protein